MRITYLHQYFNTPEMSGGTRSYEMARRLVAMGHEVNMVTSWRDEGERRGWFETEEAGIRVHWLPVPYSNRMSYPARMRAFAQFAWKASRKAASLPADVVFATSTPLTIALPGAYAARRQKVPMVFEVRDLWPEVPIAMGALKNPFLRWGARRLERFAYSRSRAVVALSPGMKAGVEASGVAPGEVAMIPNSCDLDNFYPAPERGGAFRRAHGLPTDRLLITYGGTFGRINGVDYLVRAAYALRDDDRFHFLLVGEGQERARVEALADELGVLGRNLSMLPQVTKAEMADVLAATDISVSLVIPLPELEANSANKFFDSLSAGCCTAVNHGGWQADVLEETSAGLRLAADAEVGARQLAALAQDPARVREAGVQARALAEERFSRDRLAAQLEKVLMSAVEGGP